MKRILFITGFFSLLCQIVLLRELNAAYYGIELIYTFGISFWLVGTAIGALIGRKSSIPSIKSIQIIFLISSLFISADIFFIRGIRTIAGAAPGAFLPIEKQLLFLIAAVVPISLITGIAFQRSAKLFVRLGNNLPKAYAIESAGGLAGGLLSSLFIMAGFSNLQTGLLCGISVLGIYDFGKKDKLFSFPFITQIIISLIFLILIFNSPKIDILTAAWGNPNTISSYDTPYSRITISQYNGQYSIFEDNALSYETESVSAEELCHMAMLSSETPENVLLLGGGFRGLTSEILKYKMCNLNYVEYDGKIVELLNSFLFPCLNDSANRDRIKITISDPRKFLNTNKKYDVIITCLPEPFSGQTNRYYTKEFFELCALNLKDGGILAFSLRSEENFWSPALIKRNASVYNTLKSVFHDVVVLPGPVSIFLASPKMKDFNYSTLSNRFKDRKIEAKLISPRYIQYLLTNDRYAKIEKELKLQFIEINSDDKPVCFKYSIAVWLSKFFPEASDFRFAGLTKLNAAIAFLIFILCLLVTRFFKQIKSYLIIFIISLQGMIFQIALLIKYQTSDGILYQNIGMLMTSFMAGLSIGAYFIEKFGHRTIFKKNILIILVVMFAVFNGLTGIFIYNGIISGLIITSILIFADGFIVSAVFVSLSSLSPDKQLQIISPLYAADVAGGSIGAILAGLVLIPLIGVSGTLYAGSIFILLLLIVIL